DEPCGAIVLNCSDEYVDVVFAGASESVEDECYGSGTADLWYSFTTDGSEIYTFSETSTNNIVIQIYTGDECGNLTAFGACADSPESFTTTEAGTYYVRIRPYSTASTMSVKLECIPF